jgi:hypothetical protein
MALFKDFEECRSIVITIMRKFSTKAQYQLTLAMNVCDSLIDDKDKFYRIKQTFWNILWEIPEAVDNGFENWYKKEIEETRKALAYHDKNCMDIFNCVICRNRINTINLMTDWEEGNNERKRPTLSVKY